MGRILKFRKQTTAQTQERQPIFGAGSRVVDRDGLLQGEGVVVSVYPEHLLLPGLSDGEGTEEKDVLVYHVREGVTGRELRFAEDCLLSAP